MEQPLLMLIEQDNSEIAFDYEKIDSFIQAYSNGLKFAVLLNFGLSGEGKSTFSQYISGIKHEIGDELMSQTKGASISYCGTIQNIMNRLDIEDISSVDKDLHIFNIDTEGVFYDKNEKIIEFIIPLIQSCSLLICYGNSFTDLSMISLLSDINDITNSNILIILKNSHAIIKKNQKSIQYYLNLAKKSDFVKRLNSLNIKSEIIPCVDFRDEVQHDFSKIMNKYFIARVLKLISNKKWESSSEFVNHLRFVSLKQTNQITICTYGKNDPTCSVLELIKNECDLMIKLTLENSNIETISFYDQLIKQITDKFNSMCDKANIEKQKRKNTYHEIISFLITKKINLQIISEQIEEETKIIQEEKDKIDKEKELVDFLSSEIQKVSNICLLNLINYLKNKDISSLQTIDSFFTVKCSEIMSLAAPYIRNEMFEHINNDIKNITQSIQENASSGIQLIQEQIDARNEMIIKFCVNLCINAIGTGLKFSPYPILGDLFCRISHFAPFPFQQTDNPNNQNYILKIGQRTYEATHDELNNFCQSIISTIGNFGHSILEEMRREIDISLINNLPIEYEKRDYSTFLENLIQEQ